MRLQLIFLIALLPFAWMLPQVSKSEYSGNYFWANLSFEDDKYILRKENGNNIISYPEFENPQKTGSPILPSKTFFVAIPPKSKIKVELSGQIYSFIQNTIPEANPSIVLQNDSAYTTIKSEIKTSLLKSDSYPSNETEIIGYTWLGRYFCAIVQINTHRYNWKDKSIKVIQNVSLMVNFGNSYEKNSSDYEESEFEKNLSKYILNYEQARDLKIFSKHNRANDTSGNWIDYTKEYAKLAIGENGIYQITSQQLISYGINPSTIDPKTLKIFHKGNELPLFVKGEDDGSFDLGDYIEFWAIKNYGAQNYQNIVPVGSDYLNYLDRYSDTTHVWLTWDGEYGKRVPTHSQFIPGLVDSIYIHEVQIHLESDKRLWFYDAVDPRSNLPFWQENKVWTWEVIGNSGNKIFSFPGSNFVPDSPVSITSRLISNASNIQVGAHKIGSSLNSTVPADTIMFDYKRTINFNSEFNSSTLINGSNKYRIFGLQTAAAFHQSLIDWVDIKYLRFNSVLDDSIKIIIPQNYYSSPRVIKISNINETATNLILYKIKPEIKRITNFFLSDLLPRNLTFTDTINSGDEYILIKQSSVKQPKFIVKKKFANLRNSENGADYIIISNKILQQSTLSFKDYIASAYNLRTSLVFVDDIYDEFNYGNISTESIRGFLDFAFSNWSSPAPSYLLLIGDANYDYRDVVEPAPSIRKKNLVPSYGMPVSDAWFVMWDSVNTNIPQMYVGRIPAQNDEQVLRYLNKIKSYSARRYDEWNKFYLFFSGGDPSKPSELNQIRLANQSVLNDFITPSPVGGLGTHFYKTLNPPTNFGPYTQQEIQGVLAKGGMFISYIGHSGTQTWDNGITNVNDLKNNYANRYPLISDFGCSTGRFAEPDVDAFSESFIAQHPDGQAISYLGNSSFGYLSTSLSFPKLFYKSLLIDSLNIVGQAHFDAKMKLLQQYGATEVNKVMNYCNLLFGDPALEFKVPLKPNFSISSGDIYLVDGQPSDMDDSVSIKITLKNLGRVQSDSLLISLTDFFNGNIVFTEDIKVPEPYFKTEMFVKIPTNNFIGSHVFSVDLDKDNFIDEIYEDDNSVQYQYNIFSTSIRPLNTEKYYSAIKESIKVLNPVKRLINQEESILFSISDNADFQNSLEVTKLFDTVQTTFALPSLNEDLRYWWRSRINKPGSTWSSSNSFVNSKFPFKWFFGSTFEPSDISTQAVGFDSLKRAWRISDIIKKLKLISAGSNEGKFASLQIDGEEKLPNTYFWGIATAKIDTINLEPSDLKYFIYPSNTSAPALTNYIDSLPMGTVLAMVICDDGAQSVLGYNGGTPVRNAIKTLGSYYIDSVRYRESWCLIGQKGAPVGSVPEAYKKLYQGPAEINMEKRLTADTGYIRFPRSGQSAGWRTISKKDSIPLGSQLFYKVIGIRNNGSIDTLNTLQFNNDIAMIDTLDYKIYPEIEIQSTFHVNQIKESPLLNWLGVNYSGPPELATNYQVNNIMADTVFQGDTNKYFYSFYNLGERHADSVRIMVELLNANSGIKVLKDTVLTLMPLGSSYSDSVMYKIMVADSVGSMSFRISIDSENRIREIYEDNNTYEISFWVKPDTTVSSVSGNNLTVSYDGVEIIDGDYISSNPKIKIVLNYPVWFNINDTGSVEIRIDNIKVQNAIMSTSYDTNNRIIIYEFETKLENGEHTLKIFGKNVYGKLESAPGYEKYFSVFNEMRILNTYNYPNPFTNQTFFTFSLTKIPDQLKIKVFSVAGRLVKEINKNASELRVDFNKIPWDGRDEDGDLLANGVYIYKIILRNRGESITSTYKLAIVR